MAFKLHQQLKPLAQQFALTAVKLVVFVGKTRHVWHSVRTGFLSLVYA